MNYKFLKIIFSLISFFCYLNVSFQNRELLQFCNRLDEVGFYSFNPGCGRNIFTDLQLRDFCLLSEKGEDALQETLQWSENSSMHVSFNDRKLFIFRLLQTFCRCRESVLSISNHNHLFSASLNDTLTCWAEKPGITPLAPWLVDDSSVKQNHRWTSSKRCKSWTITDQSPGLVWTFRSNLTNAK